MVGVTLLCMANIQDTDAAIRQTMETRRKHLPTTRFTRNSGKWPKRLVSKNGWESKWKGNTPSSSQMYHKNPAISRCYTHLTVGSDHIRYLSPCSEFFGPPEPQLPLDTSGQTFSRIFGTNTSAFELFVLKRKIMGPCWLNIQEPEFSDSAVSLPELDSSLSMGLIQSFADILVQAGNSDI